MAERSFGMEIKRPKIKSMKYEDFNDNEYLEQMVRELRENCLLYTFPSPRDA